MSFNLFPFLFGYTTRQFIWPLVPKECCSIHLFKEKTTLFIDIAFRVEKLHLAQ
jgi:hypothetical protein